MKPYKILMNFTVNSDTQSNKDQHYFFKTSFISKYGNLFF